MIEVIKEILMMLGIYVVAAIIYRLLCTIINKFNRWRKNRCKIKCLCKPHKYKLIWYWKDAEEAVLECKKCGKRKRVFIDYVSIKKEFH
jgi:hypothetical protein